MDIKVTGQSYCHNRFGYNVVYLPEITTDSGGEQGGVCLVVRYCTKGCVKKTGVTDDVITRENTEYSSHALTEVVDGKNRNY